ncbi:SIR2 family NAD-dependent protein deacylase [Caldimonas sp. KR1-144]|uniref:SIR2 family NAD-dependent protein deacylase n=1 Tax=Caldimonas sp. KR1-144 TaxID=3400911 RepID=UPI003C07B986
MDAALEALATTARAWLSQAESIAVLTGAGMSAESGIPTFRDALTGLWSRFNPAQLASEEGFRADPALVWNWYAERREGVRRAEPNAGHRALAAFQARHPGRVTLVTQNVDDLHQRAGSTGVIRLHGDILEDRWLERRSHACDLAQAQPGTPPRCAVCGNLVRPGVVWFGEMLPAAALAAAERAAQRCDAMLVIGTSGAVWPAAGLAHAARRAGARVIVVNPHDSELDEVAHLRLQGTAAAVLPALLDAL